MNPNPVVTATPPSTEQCWAAGCHAAAVLGLAIPFGSIIGPLIVWLIKKNEFLLVDHEGKEAINFQITTTILLFVMWIISAALAWVSNVFLVGVLLFAIAYYLPIILAGIRAYKVYTGQSFEYLSVFRFIK